jgi:hypothetical protein
MPFSRTATRHWSIWGTPFGPVRKQLSALLCSFELAMASPAVARLAANCFLTGCILRYFIEGALISDGRAGVQHAINALAGCSGGNQGLE